MAARKKKSGDGGKEVKRYTYDHVREPRAPETGHTSLLPAEELMVTLDLGSGWSERMTVGRLPDDERRVALIDMDPGQDPVLFWAGKRNRREIPVLPLQRTEIVTESRIAQIIQRAKDAAAKKNGTALQGHLFADLERSLRETEKTQRVEFYVHEEGWKNKLICGDSLQVMESLLRYEGLRGRVQMVYVDPPYGIKYDSNFQQRVDSTRNEEKEEVDDVLTIKAYRDTWALGVHSYLTYLQERLYLCRELLADTGSIFVQISDENVHRVRQLMDEVFGAQNFVSQIAFTKTTGLASAKQLAARCDYLVWYAKTPSFVYQPLYEHQDPIESGFTKVELAGGERRSLSKEERRGVAPLPDGARLYMLDNLTKPGPGAKYTIEFRGKEYDSGARWWGMPKEALQRLIAAGRVELSGKTLRYVRYFDDFPYKVITNLWTGFAGASDPVYVVQTNEEIVARCVLMTTRPGDLVLDPTCGSGTTSRAAEQFGRRWVTCDTSRVAINVARRELLKAVFRHFRTRNGTPTSGFDYETAERITPTTVAYGREPERVELLDAPLSDNSVVRVCGPFEVMAIGRYSVDDWRGYVSEGGTLANYVEVISRLYRRNAALEGSSGLVHAIVESESGTIALSIGPLAGRVTGKQIMDAVQDAVACGVLEVHVLGWAFEANVGEVKSQLESRGKVKVVLVMIRPDTLAEGLKITKPETLFSPLALPDLRVEVRSPKGASPEVMVTLNGVAVFDRATRSTEYKAADSGYVAAWYLDEDYDGDCFVDCQAFFDFKNVPDLRGAVDGEVDPEEFALQTESRWFPLRSYKRVAVKVVDVFGNESTVVKDLA